MRKILEFIRDLAWVAFSWAPRQAWKRKPLRAAALGFLAVAAAVTLIMVQNPPSPGMAAAAPSVLPQAEPAAPLVDAGELTESLDAYLALHPELAGSVRVSVGEEFFDYHPELRFETASIVKVDILATLLYLQDAPLTRDQRDMASDMITLSDNDATNELYGDIGGPAGLSKANEAFGLSETEAGWDWGAVSTSAADQVRLWHAVMYPGVLSEDEVALIRELTASVVSEQVWGVDRLSVPGSVVRLKNGWDWRDNLDGRWLAHSVGMIETPGEPDVFVAILTSGHTDYEDALDVVSAIGSLIAAAV
ncbi:hypothetical protein Afil01_57320 [Actinorhabdospora filicis]|uniref:Beta-lactamase class A catalytic domain-containing protein n=1 Tax=Actinorhabdospora filicis TaxID=1785913 RepID=A0A9W6SS27_9ACTN|nr:serine hydrolase [Actinorhabdospora filicis]GLZ80925.1 hypothetical protein Afil01_57320 [Actinorhabdospora filicis]